MKETKGKKTVIVNSDYEYLKTYLDNIPENFNSLGLLIDARRNIIREDIPMGTRLVIKSFKRIYLPNRMRYSFFSPSKAQRAFDNAKRLLDNGFKTPEPIAYIEVKRNGLITESYFVSKHIDFLPLEKPDVKSAINLQLLKELANYTFRLHKSNIYHVDYTLGNILLKKQSSGYEFALVDNNRMKFGNISLTKGIKNFVRLGLPDAQLAELAKEYAARWNADGLKAVEQLFNFRAIKARKNEFKGSLKRALASLKTALGLNSNPQTKTSTRNWCRINYLLIGILYQVQSNPLMFSDL